MVVAFRLKMLFVKRMVRDRSADSEAIFYSFANSFPLLYGVVIVSTVPLHSSWKKSCQKLVRKAESRIHCRSSEINDSGDLMRGA